MKTFEQVQVVPIPTLVYNHTEDFIRGCEMRFASIESYLQNRPRVSMAGWKGKSVTVCKINGQIAYYDANDFIKSQNGIFANAEGLSVAAPLLVTMESKFPRNTAVYGFDTKENLWEPSDKDETLFVPFVTIKKDTFYFGLSSFGKKSCRPETTGSYLIYISA